MLILISGSSGAGKNTVIQTLIDRHNNIKFLQSCTTRAKRPSEKPDAYVYLSKDEFDQKLKNGEIVENEEIHQNFYGILASSLNQVVTENDKDIHYIKDVGVLGQISLVRALKNKVPVLTIYLKAPRGELIKRLKARGDKDIDLRLSRMEFEDGYVDNFDEVINNRDLEKTITRIEKIIPKYQKKFYSTKLI